VILVIMSIARPAKNKPIPRTGNVYVVDCLFGAYETISVPSVWPGEPEYLSLAKCSFPVVKGDKVLLLEFCKVNDLLGIPNREKNTLLFKFLHLGVNKPFFIKMAYIFPFQKEEMTLQMAYHTFHIFFSLLEEFYGAPEPVSQEEEG